MISNGLNLHRSKTQALSIAQLTHKSGLSLSFSLCNNIVNISSTAKYQCILIDDQLLFVKSRIEFPEEKLPRSVASWLN